MKHNLKNLLILAGVLIPLIYTYNVLHYQIDPFVSSTIISAKLISQLGSANAGYNYIHNVTQTGTPGWTWQGDTESFLGSVYGSGIILVSLHMITGAPLLTLSYLPIPYFLIILLSFLFARFVLAKIKSSNTRMPEIKIFLIIAFLSTFALVGTDLVGRYYGLEFHAINEALLILFLYLMLTGIGDHRLRRHIIELFVLFSAMVIIHVDEPIIIEGALIVYLLSILIFGKSSRDERYQRKQIMYLLIPMTIIASLQAFYFEVLGGFDFSFIDRRLLAYVSGEFTQPIFGQPAIPGISQIYLAFLEKFYGYLGLVYVISIFVVYFAKKRLKVINGSSNQFFLFCLIVGGSLAYSISFFSYYGGFNFGFLYPSLLQLFLMLSISYLFVKGGKRLRGFFMIGIIMLAAISSSSTIIIIYQSTVSQGPFVFELGTESSQILPFVLKNGNGSRYLIGGSIGVTSTIYRELVDSPLIDTRLVIPVTLGGYTQFYENGGAHNMSAELHATLDLLVFTRHELDSGMYGDVSSYLSSSQMSILTSTLNANSDIIFASDTSVVYFFR